MTSQKQRSATQIPISTTLNPESILESIEITGFNSSGLPIQQSQTSSIANQSMLSPERPRLIQRNLKKKWLYTNSVSLEEIKLIEQRNKALADHNPLLERSLELEKQLRES